jgi:hypothetical protein
MILWEILVPTVRMDKPGRYFTTRYHKVWDSKVRAITGGLTILKPVKGEWVSPEGTLFAERMIPVRIACSEKDIEKISDLTANYYNQKAIMYYKVSDYVVIKNYESR